MKRFGLKMGASRAKNFDNSEKGHYSKGWIRKGRMVVLTIEKTTTSGGWFTQGAPYYSTVHRSVCAFRDLGEGDGGREYELVRRCLDDVPNRLV
jgi:hypothetical protein